MRSVTRKLPTFDSLRRKVNKTVMLNKAQFFFMTSHVTLFFGL